MLVTIDLVSPRGCKCETTRLTRKLRCIEIAMSESGEGPLGIKGQSDNLPTTNERFQNFEKLMERLSNLGLSDIQEPPDFIDDGSVIEQEGENDILRRIMQQQASGIDRNSVEPIVLKGAHYRHELPADFSMEVHAREAGYLRPEDEPYHNQSNGYARKPTKSKIRELKMKDNFVEGAESSFIPSETPEKEYGAESQRRKLEPLHHRSTIPPEMVVVSTITENLRLLQTSRTVYETKTTGPSILPESNLEEPVYHSYREKPKSRKMYEIDEEPSKAEVAQEIQLKSTIYPRPMKAPKLSGITSGINKPIFHEATTQTTAPSVHEFSQSPNDTELPEAGFSGLSRRGVGQGKSSKKILINAIECVDLLGSEKCAQRDKGPDSECENSGQMRDELCRKTCHVCQGTMRWLFKLFLMSVDFRMLSLR